MRAVILERVGKVSVLDVPDPAPPPGGLVVRILAALTCGTDVKAYKRGHPKIPLPSPLGHEYTGVVHAVGAGVTRFAVGDPIMGVHSAPCGECYYCRRGRGNLCASIMDTKVMGAFAEFLALPAHVVAQNVFLRPADLPLRRAVFLEPLACVVHGMSLIAPQSGETAVVFGAGPIGLLFVLLLRRAGCRVLMVEPQADRRGIARLVGADFVLPPGDALDAVRELTDGEGADVVIECTGRTDVWTGAIDYPRRGGRVMLFGGAPADTKVCFDTERLHYDELTVHGAFHYVPADVAVAADLLASGVLDPTPLITGETDLDGVPAALDRLARGEGVKILVTP